MDVLSELPSLGSCSTISAALSRNETAQTSYKANRHFLNNSVSSAPPLKSLSGITARVGGGGRGVFVTNLYQDPFLLWSFLWDFSWQWSRSFGPLLASEGDVGTLGRLSPQPKSERAGREKWMQPLLWVMWYLCVWGHVRAQKIKLWHISCGMWGNQFTSVFCCHGFHISPHSHQKRHLRCEMDVTFSSKYSHSTWTQRNWSRGAFVSDKADLPITLGAAVGQH